MILPDPKEAVHKAWLYRVLTSICDHKWISEQLAFKGGTASAMQGYLDRFSVDLDFDYLSTPSELPRFRQELENIFDLLGLTIKDRSDTVPQYFLSYPQTKNQHGLRSTLKIDITFPAPKANIYELIRLKEIDKIINCQTIETMFANKLVAFIDRFEKNGSIAGRDLYDIHHYFLQGFGYNKHIIMERRGIDDIKLFFNDLVNFINKKITQTIINQDLNTLLDRKKFQSIRKTIKNEVIVLLSDEILRL
ncbi:MAG: nucleotidyl transferase AbiEii/AbiGii toxin family protein [Spirochaetia bacterium]|jgi:predicted nucleotidyltransferase component of viral defense system|nr:nucleotidyl transferase AbiEii/AbiGii toxin family protein [Spirochaetia bacterium]